MKYLTLLVISCVLSHACGGQGSARSAALPRSTPEAEGIDSAGLLSLVNVLENKIDAVHSIMLVRHGKVVAEGWWNPYAPGDIHITYSATKSFTSTAIGFAAQEGLLSVHDKVLSFFPDLAPKEPSAQMQNMRIRDLLIMSTGHQSDTMDRLRARKDGQWRRAFLETAVEHRPGTHFVYNSGASYMLSAIVQKVSGKTIQEYLQPRLFEPLGIENAFWGLSPEGIGLGDGGLSIKTEDLAKFGLLYLQKGMWNGRRLLSEQWVDEATSRQTSTGSDPDSNWDQGYGYQFWRNKVDGYRADGAQGQFSFVLPKDDIVLAVTSGTTNTRGVMDIVWEQLLPAVHDKALPENHAAREKLAAKLGALSLPMQPGASSSPRIAEVSGAVYTFTNNEQGIETVAVDFSASRPVLTIRDADGTHHITCGVGNWVRQHTDFQKRISMLFDEPGQGLAACGAWTDENTFKAKLCFNETPYTMTATLKFEADILLLDMEHNVRWGPTRHPQIIGKRQKI
jgi:CubicO group peptidase (beta-lactamase class C family)